MVFFIGRLFEMLLKINIFRKFALRLLARAMDRLRKKWRIEVVEIWPNSIRSMMESLTSL